MDVLTLETVEKVINGLDYTDFYQTRPLLSESAEAKKITQFFTLLIVGVFQQSLDRGPQKVFETNLEPGESEAICLYA